jgi:anti-repressor protein
VLGCSSPILRKEVGGGAQPWKSKPRRPFAALVTSLGNFPIDGETSMSDSTNTPFPAVREGVIGAGLVQTADARELHACLGVGRDFTTWIKKRIAQYGFAEHVDYVVIDSPNRGDQSGRGGDRRSVEYHLTLDMAKELAMVENNERGRATRRYFIEVEKRAHEAAAIDMNALGGMVKRIVARQLSEVVPALVREQVATGHNAVIQGVSAGQVIEMAGVTARKGLRGLPRWVSSRLYRFHATKGVVVRLASLGSRQAYVFDPMVSREWLMEGGKAEIEQKVAERRGQGVLRLV